MNEDDTDDKVRRNLVGFSAFILIGAWLDVPLSAVTEKALSAGTLDAVAPWKVWTAVAAVLSYLIWRFSLVACTPAHWANLKGELQHLKAAKSRRLVERAVLRYGRSGAESPIFGGKLHEVVVKRTDTTRRESQSPELMLTNLSVEELSFLGASAIFPAGGSPYIGNVSLAYEWGRNGANGGSRVDFEIRGVDRAKVVMLSAGHLAIYSVGSMRILLPLLVAGVALCIVVYRLAMLFWLPCWIPFVC